MDDARTRTEASAGPERGRRRRPSAGPADERPSDRGRFSAKRKRDAVLRLLRGEDLDSLARELGVNAGTLSQWQQQFLAHGEAGLKSRAPDARDEEIARLKAKVGELTMDNELLNEKIDRMEAGHPLPTRRSRP